MTTKPTTRPENSYDENTEARYENHDDHGGTSHERNDDVEVHVEFVIIDGPDGARLQELQAAAVYGTLRALLRARASITKGDPQ